MGLFRDTAKYFRRDFHITILEIGVSRGRSTRAFNQGLKERREAQYGTGDLWGVDIEDCDAVRRKFVEPAAWNFLQGDSRTVPWEKTIDVLFIDGDHSYEMAKADFTRFEPFVRPGGLIYMHDVLIEHFGVKDFWEEIQYPKFILPLNFAGLGIVRKPK